MKGEVTDMIMRNLKISNPDKLKKDIMKFQREVGNIFYSEEQINKIVDGMFERYRKIPNFIDDYFKFKKK